MHIWELFIDYIFPASPEEILVRIATSADIKKEYLSASKNNVYYFCNYKHQLVKASITTAKFSHNKKAIKLLGDLLSLWLTEHTQGGTLLVPIPLHSKREKERGYNQVTRVLEQISRANIYISKNILTRNRHTNPQTKLAKEDRAKNIVGAFSVDVRCLEKILTPEIKQVIICDDVYTTGSTLKEAREVLSPHLPKDCELICLAWAH